MAALTEGTFGQDFELKNFIGQGTFAKVFRCVEKNTGRDFAVKAFQDEDENFDPKLIDNEVDIWRTLQHRNIVSLYKRFHEDNRVWVVLEHSAWRSIKSNRLSWRRKQKYYTTGEKQLFSRPNTDICGRMLNFRFFLWSPAVSLFFFFFHAWFYYLLWKPESIFLVLVRCSY